MDTLKLRRIAKKYGTPGVLFVGTVLATHNVFKNKRLLLVGGSLVVASLWVVSTLDVRCTSTTSALTPGIGQSTLLPLDSAQYEIVELKPLDGGQFALPLGLNNKGVAVGISDNANENIRGVIWENGAIKDLGSMGGSADVAAFGINDRGQAVGWADGGDTLSGFVWENGKFTNVGNLGYPFAATLGINNRSQAIGVSATKAKKVLGFVWENGKIKSIGSLPKFDPAIPQDIADNGTVVGNAYDRDGYPHPFAWSGGKMNALPVWKEYSAAIALNNDDFAVGVDFDKEGERVTPVLWRRGKVDNLPLPKGFTFGIASDINNSGVIVGTIASDKNICPVLWDKGKIIDLSAQVDGSGIQLFFARSINDKGEITAFGVRGEDFVCVLLKPKSRSEGFEYNAADWSMTGIPAPYLGLMYGRQISDSGSSVVFSVIHSVANFAEYTDEPKSFLLKRIVNRLSITSEQMRSFAAQ